MANLRRVVQYSMEGKPLRVFSCIREAERAVGVTHVSSVCRRKRISDGGFRWSYEGEDLPAVSAEALRKSLQCSEAAKGLRHNK